MNLRLGPKNSNHVFVKHFPNSGVLQLTLCTISWMLILNSSIHYISNDNDASLQLYIVFNLWSFQWNKSLKSRYTSSDKPLAQPLVNAIEEVLNQRTVTPFWNESRCWNYVFQTAKDTLKGWNVDFNIWVESFCDFSQYTLHIDKI